MPVPRYRRSHFDSAGEEPMGPLVNLTDVMLVFAVGLMVALAASNQNAEENLDQNSGAGALRSPAGVSVEAGRELPEMPSGMGEAGSGYEAVGRVYRDPQSGRLILIDD